jgi:hypothetical protein
MYNSDMQSRSNSQFDVSFRSFIADKLAGCRYVKDLERLLAPESNFQVRWTPDEVRLENYYLDGDDNTERFTGVCYELTYHLGRYLKQKLDSQYIFMAADGNCPHFYFEERTNHTFILAMPRVTVDRTIQQLQASTAQIPANVFVIDPSFGLYGEANVDDAVEGYRIKYTYDFEEIRPSRDRCEALPFQWFKNGYGQTHTLPIGLSQYLLPNVPSMDEGLLLVVGFQIKPDTDRQPQVLLGTKKSTESYPTICKDVEEQLSLNHPLRRFLERLRTELMQSR